MRGKFIILINCEENIDNVIIFFIYYRNIVEENDKNEGTYIQYILQRFVFVDLMKYNVIVFILEFYYVIQ